MRCTLKLRGREPDSWLRIVTQRAMTIEPPNASFFDGPFFSNVRDGNAALPVACQARAHPLLNESLRESYLWFSSIGAGPCKELYPLESPIRANSINSGPVERFAIPEKVFLVSTMPLVYCTTPDHPPFYRALKSSSDSSRSDDWLAPPEKPVNGAHLSIGSGRPPKPRLRGAVFRHRI